MTTTITRPIPHPHLLPLPPPKKLKRSSAVSKPQKPAQKSRLSFADDEEDDENTTEQPPSFISRRPAVTSSSSRLSKTRSTSSHHKLTSRKDRITSSSATPSNVQPQAGTYTKEALLELQKNTKILGSTSRSTPSAPPEPTTVILKGLVKPELVSQEVEINDVGDDEDDAITELRLGFGQGGIMDQATINVIGGEARAVKAVPSGCTGCIALDGGSNHGEAEGLSNEEPEFQGRIALIGEKVDSKKGVFEDSGGKLGDSGIGREEKTEVNGDDNGVDEEDEEDKMWEEEQVRKGLGRRMDEGDNRAVGVSSTSSVPFGSSDCCTASGCVPECRSCFVPFNTKWSEHWRCSWVVRFECDVVVTTG